MTEYDIKTRSETLNVTPEILERYNVPGPRYTSYPTAPEWLDTFGPSDFEEALKRSNETRPVRPLSLYMHLPFCDSLCLFCGCNTVIKKDHAAAAPYLEKLKWETGRVAGSLDTSRPVIQFHWGGGTPTYFSASQLEDLFLHTRERFRFAADAEIGVEIDPRVTNEGQLAVLRRLGFNRVSMGIQDFDPVVQKTVRRFQSYEQTRDIFELCRSLKYESINVDLIYGLPHQTPESFSDSIDRIIGLDPDRIAMFSYAHVPWMKKQQGALSKYIPLGMDKYQIFRRGIERFTRAGYQYIGMDHFARPDDELCRAQSDRTLHRNFQGYTTKAGADLVGLGVSSISEIGRVYAQNRRDLGGYYAAVDSGALATMRGMRLEDDDILRRAVISRLLCHCVLRKAEIEAEFGIRFDDYFADELARLETLRADGLVALDPGNIAVTSLGRIFIRNVGMVFDRYLRKPQSKPVFSKTL
ncbi:MAG: oxygen-independent coproporphyrinogen III oxidase [Acidobacteria bacterium]|nr:oxygen-independent coproporphyrinogen III oxidase [Acidobacteriota bacterium]